MRWRTPTTAGGRHGRRAKGGRDRTVWEGRDRNARRSFRCQNGAIVQREMRECVSLDDGGGRPHDRTVHLIRQMRASAIAKGGPRVASGRPEPLHARMEDRSIRFWGWLRRATDPRGPGGREIVHTEAVELVALWEEDVPDRSLLTQTARHVAACLGGSDGMDSYRAQTSWHERQRAKSAAAIEHEAA
jgi:hypothetical protein